MFPKPILKIYWLKDIRTLLCDHLHTQRSFWYFFSNGSCFQYHFAHEVTYLACWKKIIGIVLRSQLGTKGRIGLQQKSEWRYKASKRLNIDNTIMHSDENNTNNNSALEYGFSLFILKFISKAHNARHVAPKLNISFLVLRNTVFKLEIFLKQTVLFGIQQKPGENVIYSHHMVTFKLLCSRCI